MRHWINLLEADVTVTLKNDIIITLHHFEEPFDDGGHEESMVLNVYAKLGDETVGSLMYDLAEDYVRGVSVDENLRRLGVATALYDHAESVLGYAIKAGPYLETDGELFWAARRNKAQA